MFDPEFISDYRILNIINKCTLLIQSPDGKTRQININDAKPVSFQQLTTCYKILNTQC